MKERGFIVSIIIKYGGIQAVTFYIFYIYIVDERVFDNKQKNKKNFRIFALRENKDHE